MTGNGNHTTYIFNYIYGDDWGMVQMAASFTHRKQ